MRGTHVLGCLLAAGAAAPAAAQALGDDWDNALGTQPTDAPCWVFGFDGALPAWLRSDNMTTLACAPRLASSAASEPCVGAFSAPLSGYLLGTSATFAAVRALVRVGGDGGWTLSATSAFDRGNSGTEGMALVRAIARGVASEGAYDAVAAFPAIGTGSASPPSFTRYGYTFAQPGDYMVEWLVRGGSSGAAPAGLMLDDITLCRPPVVSPTASPSVAAGPLSPSRTTSRTPTMWHTRFPTASFTALPAASLGATSAPSPPVLLGAALSLIPVSRSSSPSPMSSGQQPPVESASSGGSPPPSIGSSASATRSMAPSGLVESASPSKGFTPPATPSRSVERSASGTASNTPAAVQPSQSPLQGETPTPTSTLKPGLFSVSSSASPMPVQMSASRSPVWFSSSSSQSAAASRTATNTPLVDALPSKSASRTPVWVSNSRSRTAAATRTGTATPTSSRIRSSRSSTATRSRSGTATRSRSGTATRTRKPKKALR